MKQITIILVFFLVVSCDSTIVLSESKSSDDNFTQEISSELFDKESSSVSVTIQESSNALSSKESLHINSSSAPSLGSSVYYESSSSVESSVVSSVDASGVQSSVLESSLLMSSSSQDYSSDGLSSLVPSSEDGSSAETENVFIKNNPQKVFVHYMPWFKTKAVRGSWGFHWTMANKNPDIVINDKREIAAHYYPQIGPYDSTDPRVLKYHALMIKAAGFDGVFINWYGTFRVNDFGENFDATEAFVAVLDEVGLEYAFVYEDWTVESAVAQGLATDNLSAMNTDLAYLNANHFSKQNYLSVREQPSLLVFGPRLVTEPFEWTGVVQLNGDPDLVFLAWHGEADVDGGFSWVAENADLEYWYGNIMSGLGVKISSVFPKFHDYYLEGGSGDGYTDYPATNGQRMRDQLALTKQYPSDVVQVATWNDIGEGTQIEPTFEDGYFYLEILQEYTGVRANLEDLELIKLFYDMVDNSFTQQEIDAAYQTLISGDFSRARSMISK